MKKEYVPIVVYDSLLGKTKDFIGKLSDDFYKVKIEDGLKVDVPFVLVTYTVGKGEVPPSTRNFLDSFNNAENLLGVASAGHRNWGRILFARSGDIISNDYGVPLIHKFEMRGNKTDVEKIERGVRSLYADIREKGNHTE